MPVVISTHLHHLNLKECFFPEITLEFSRVDTLCTSSGFTFALCSTRNGHL